MANVKGRGQKMKGALLKLQGREGPISGFVFIKAGISMYRVTKYYTAVSK
jgi:hypothetical protein